MTPRRKQEAAPVAPKGDLLQIGEVLEGHYEIEALIGQGGMGQVYRARDRWLERPVAIKAAWPEMASYLHREARTLGRFHHPGLVMIHAYGKHKDIWYAALEYLSGSSLMQGITEREAAGAGPFPIGSALDLAIGLCDALAPLHDAGIAHCDLKPGNVMWDRGRVVLIDLGSTRDEQGRAEDGYFCGSPPFMAPEVAAGQVRAGEAHLVDVYAIGVILYTLLDGQPPFHDVDSARVVARQLAEEAPALTSTHRGLSGLASLIASLLDRDPSRRPKDVRTLKHALLGFPRR